MKTNTRRALSVECTRLQMQMAASGHVSRTQRIARMKAAEATVIKMEAENAVLRDQNAARRNQNMTLEAQLAKTVDDLRIANARIKELEAQSA